MHLHFGSIDIKAHKLLVGRRLVLGLRAGPQLILIGQERRHCFVSALEESPCAKSHLTPGTNLEFMKFYLNLSEKYVQPEAVKNHFVSEVTKTLAQGSKWH